MIESSTSKFGKPLDIKLDVINEINGYKICKDLYHEYINLFVTNDGGHRSYAYFEHKEDNFYYLREIVTYRWGTKRNLASYIIITAIEELNWKLILKPEEIITYPARNFLIKMLKENKIQISNFDNRILSVDELAEQFSIDNTDYGYIIEKIPEA